MKNTEDHGDGDPNRQAIDMLILGLKTQPEFEVGAHSIDLIFQNSCLCGAPTLQRGHAQVLTFAEDGKYALTLVIMATMQMRSNRLHLIPLLGNVQQLKQLKTNQTFPNRTCDIKSESNLF